MPTAAVRSHVISWREAGPPAAPPALLLHCALAHAGAFGPLMARLSDRLAMRALDLPGHGGSGLEPGMAPQAQAVADALAAIRDLPPVHLIGHSFGGAVALRLALEAPRRVASLTLIEPVQFSLLAEGDPAAHAAEVAANSRFVEAARRQDWPQAAEIFLGRWGAVPRDAVAQRSSGAVERMPLLVAIDPELSDPAQAGVRLADLRRLRSPLLLVAGAESPATVAAILDLIAAAAPGAARLTVQGAGHMLPLTHPGPLAEAIADFVSAPARG